MANATPAPQVLMSSEQFKQQQIAEAKADAEQNRRDETSAGGRYITATGRAVDANGKLIDEQTYESSAAKAAASAAAAQVAIAQANADAAAAAKETAEREATERAASAEAAQALVNTAQQVAQQAAVNAGVTEVERAGAGEPDGGDAVKMTHAELDEAAAMAPGEPVDLTGANTKAEKAARLRAAGVEVS